MPTLLPQHAIHSTVIIIKCDWRMGTVGICLLSYENVSPYYCICFPDCKILSRLLGGCKTADTNCLNTPYYIY